MASSNFTSIPTIDLSKITSPSSKAKLLYDLRHALLSVGFLYVTNHSVPDHVIKELVNALPLLFDLPSFAKNEVALQNSSHFLGYSETGAETTAGKVDAREQFEFSTELIDDWTPENLLADRLKGPNQWPSAYPELRQVVERYIEELTRLSEKFLELVAEALDLPPTTFLSFLSDQHRLKLVHYPQSLPGVTDGQGVGPHKDSSGWWTFLLQASDPSVKGLQALNKSGDWIDVPNIPGTFVVNIGQGFEVVTNGVCKATTHRVLSGPSERFGVPFFQGMRRDLTKEEAVGTLKEHFEAGRFAREEVGMESQEGRQIDSAFLRGKYDTWGETQLRTKIRSHRDVGRKFYGDVFEKYTNDD
ncbi:2OG-Fe(II) oxygenase [Lentithecium fluviatile CBS 122367]|uniref:2OG-Fe(II) oxygenase n=1 Tax=Lentithecium fluviatile CBS 122367 TaxID=1168545 RepID=A0A6G1J705_9PLEO|nr:2OG-Fe(II) oxygenase [Lentithecium fluviatile CBS 122367]